MTAPAAGRPVRALTVDDLEDLAVGARVLAAGTEESAYHVALDWAAAELAAHGPVPLLPVDRLPGTGLCVAVTLAGASAALAEQLPTGEEPVRAVRAVERVAGRAAEAVVPLNAAAENALIALATAARCGLPLVDGDGCGRVLPLLEQTLFTLAGVAPAPLALATPSGDVVAVESARGRVEDLVRPLVLASGGWAVAAAYPMDGARLASCLVPGTVSRAVAAGAATGRARFAPWRPRSLCRGRIVAVEQSAGAYENHENGAAGPLTGLPGGPAGGTAAAVPHGTLGGVPDRVPLPSRPTSVLVEEDEGLRRRFRLEAHNEILLVLADGAPAASLPDQILMLSRTDRRVLDVERAVPGTAVEVVVIEAPAAWYTPEGRALARTGSGGTR
ncbi:DUF917 domain-containing protein [Streptomyces hydrogenans]|uniref:DUF917 domain-containing protein n=1 Tax=Streptomyces hydrogenans TaxID=1873719 RepID=A0ABQ3PQV8_9ACTN|nr:DUF917 domain-containing protein [Streptomyces hydrogenans]GHF98786.1 hypothetical protein GCM10018784_07970 [Streptomyces hydrogenans]GHI27398.1 hypothetical protein Shyd_87690 [Streptomyces hydrogenans]